VKSSSTRYLRVRPSSTQNISCNENQIMLVLRPNTPISWNQTHPSYFLTLSLLYLVSLPVSAAEQFLSCSTPQSPVPARTSASHRRRPHAGAGLGIFLILPARFSTAASSTHPPLLPSEEIAGGSVEAGGSGRVRHGVRGILGSGCR
jgi:hypothetical protein